MKKYGIIAVFCLLTFSVMAFAAGHVGHVVPPVVDPAVSGDAVAKPVIVSPASQDPVIYSLLSTSLSLDAQGYPSAAVVNSLVAANKEMSADKFSPVATTPVFALSGDAGDAGKIFVVTVSLDANVIPSSDAGKLFAAAKIKPDGAVYYEFAGTLAALTVSNDAKPGRFAIKQNGQFLTSNAIMTAGSGAGYNPAQPAQLYLAIVDGGKFDLDGKKDAKVLDPGCVGTKTAPAGGSSSGGCSAFGFAPMGLLLLVPLALLARKR